MPDGTGAAVVRTVTGIRVMTVFTGAGEVTGVVALIPTGDPGAPAIAKGENPVVFAEKDTMPFFVSRDVVGRATHPAGVSW